MKLTSILTCPHCGHRASETMPTDACQFFYECTGCGTLLRRRRATAACTARMAMFRVLPFRKLGNAANR